MTPTMTKEQFAKTFDMTLLRPSATRDDVVRFCESAGEVQPAAVCIFPIWIKTALKVLAGAGIPVCSVAGFPTGCSTRPIKAQEIADIVRAGATEVDFVLNIGALKTGDWGIVGQEIRHLIESARMAGLETESRIVTKVIIECAYLTDDEKAKAAQVCRDVRADFVKTSTGFGPSGATVEDVRLLRKTVGPDIGVKAAGGILTLEAALAMIEAGASRIGSSKAAEIISAYEPK